MPDNNAPKGKGKAGILGKKYGGVKTQWWVLGGGLTAAGVYYFYRKQSAASTASGTTASDPSIDPSTGIPYADELAQQQASGTGATDYSGEGVYGSNYADLAGIEQGLATISSQLGTLKTAGSTGATHPSDKSWLAAAEKKLRAAGYHQGAIVAALTAYLLGVPLTKHQEGIVQAAIQKEGLPPRAPSHSTVLPAGHKTETQKHHRPRHKTTAKRPTTGIKRK